MLAGKRAARVGDQILREVSMLLLTKIMDPRVQGVTTTGVQLSNDLKQARIFFSVIGDEDRVKRAQAGLNSAKGFIKREIGKRMKLRYVPEIIFLHDSSLESGSRIERIFDKLGFYEPENLVE